MLSAEARSASSSNDQALGRQPRAAAVAPPSEQCEEQGAAPQGIGPEAGADDRERLGGSGARDDARQHYAEQAFADDEAGRHEHAHPLVPLAVTGSSGGAVVDPAAD